MSRSAQSRTCPVCGAPADPHRSPFCSRRCADIDLHRWLSESYRLPGSVPAEGDDPAPSD